MPEAPGVGTYGDAPNSATQSTFTTSDLPMLRSWTIGDLAIIESVLSPASLCFSRSSEISFFTALSEQGLGGPTFVAISTEQGPKIFKPGEQVDPARMRESWFVAWFAGAIGWTNWDAPWLLTLQHRPRTIRFDTNGLHFKFAGEAGYAAMMPLYGAYKPLQAGQERTPFATLKEKKKRVLTWEWHKALPADPLARARYWASALREFPISCDESFSVDRAHDAVTIQQSFRWFSWRDDWNTKAMKLAPISPVLALAYAEGFPADFSKKPFDMEIFTDYGPYYGIQDAESYRVTLPVLRYVHETAGVGDGARAGLEASCFQSWQTAHQTGRWEALRSQWPGMRDEFLGRATTDWPAFASAGERSPLEQTADALGAARIAYRLRDMDTYLIAAHLFSRALVQLSAQQRGAKYFREHQPWRTMEALGPEATLTGIDRNGWMTGPAAFRDSAADVPDIARLLRATGPPVPERLTESAPKFERLIPGSPATSFFRHELVRSNSQSGLVQTIVAGSLTQLGAVAEWPQIVWPGWKSAGVPWSFGRVTLPKAGSAQTQTFANDPNRRIIVIESNHRARE